LVPSKFLAIRRALAARPPRRVEAAPEQREAAVALILVPGQHGAPEILLIKRAEHAGDPWSGQIALPGGRRDGADRDLLRTAVRETQEETAIGLSETQLLGGLDDLSPVSRHLPQLIVRPFVFSLPEQPTIHLSDEVALHLWAPCDELLARRVTEDVEVQGMVLTVPGYRIGPHLVWGMTERILTPFLELVSAA
jgi:8-oxo-dGTP pyrophosphatase MutT (NUDIX family)